MKNKRILAMLLCALMLTPAIASCSEKKDDEGKTTQAAQDSETQAETEYDPLSDLNFEGQKFRIYTSTNNPGGVGNSNYLIEGPEESTGEVVNDSALQRNMRVEEMLTVDLEFTQIDLMYTGVAAEMRKLVSTADDAFDLIINDLFPIAAVVLEGAFVNAQEGEFFNFEKPYWYKDFMDDVTIGHGANYILAGDFFIDMIRSAHGLIFNKTLMADYNIGDTDLYQIVNDGTWTLDKLNEYISIGYKDLNGNSKADADDQFGYVANQIWGPSIPFIVSGNPGFLTRDEDGIPAIAVNNEKSVELIQKLYNIFYNDASNANLGDTYLNVFQQGRSFFMGYNRLGSLEDLRNMEDEIGILPYPKLNENADKYVTSVHDTTEIGVIPITIQDLSFVSAVTEALCRETMKIVLPAYYETGLKVKYTRDNESAQMIDIIHDNIGNGFVLAYDDALNCIFMKNVFYVPLSNKNTNFASAYKSNEKPAQKKLDKMIDTFLNATT